jgi:hypothetical protein
MKKPAEAGFSITGGDGGNRTDGTIFRTLALRPMTPQLPDEKTKGLGAHRAAPRHPNSTHGCSGHRHGCRLTSKTVFHIFSIQSKKACNNRCKPLISNEFLVGSASFELATPAV